MAKMMSGLFAIYLVCLLLILLGKRNIAFALIALNAILIALMLLTYDLPNVPKIRL
jgi:hypothetical protein